MGFLSKTVKELGDYILNGIITFVKFPIFPDASLENVSGTWSINGNDKRKKITLTGAVTDLDFSNIKIAGTYKYIVDCDGNTISFTKSGATISKAGDDLDSTSGVWNLIIFNIVDSTSGSEIIQYSITQFS